MATETEIKLAWPGSAAEARAHLERHGYRIATPRVLEIDQLFDRASRELQHSDRVLRLRRVRSSGEVGGVLTYKGPATPGEYKSREEIEFAVPDPEACGVVLARLGYQPTFRYEKYRTIWRANSEPGAITLDETPIGIFLELEGPEDWIDAAARRLGFTSAAYITSSYARLYRKYQDQNPSAAPDMTFTSPQ